MGFISTVGCSWSVCLVCIVCDCVVHASGLAWTLILVILPVFWVPAWAFGGSISTVGNMFVAGLVCSHCVWRYVCGWAMLYMSDSGRVTLWCMLQAGVSNHVSEHVRCRPSVQPLCLEIRVWLGHVVYE